MSIFFVGELYDIDLSTIKILLISSRNGFLQIDKAENSKAEKKCMRGDFTEMKYFKPFTYNRKKDRFVVTLKTNNDSSGLFYLDKSNYGRSFHINAKIVKYSFCNNDSLIAGWKLTLEKIEPVSSLNMA